MGPYTSNVRKAQYLTYCECGKTRRKVVKLCNLAKSTAADIWKRSLAVKEERLTASLPDLVSVKEKSGRLNKKNYKKQQHHVAVEEGFKACRITIET
ncbi:uncharacterized protein K441DRAFT_657209 [Cenococcum geophilum 1.58]|uniref:uncharacterized protein n=1 Tax=Cenococcum geophilum 1.58 TaxID=794803 RepID=UPI00358F0732|nr:hypothetical protein K441DRAFT_657209 [Cenococcum geophilum 1.58]